MEGYAVILNTQLSEALIKEGFIRDLVHQIQVLRKEAGFDVEDRIQICINNRTDAHAQTLIQENEDYIRSETLARKIFYDSSGKNGFTREFTIADFIFNLTLER
jgi:isoleucyl-tRNA synthetase